MIDLSAAHWRKSTRTNGQGACVEVAAVWRKSSRSNGQGACVEAASVGEGRRIAIRDSKDPSGPALVITPAAWRSFTTRLKAASR
jgi:hypothetical protein